MPIDFDYKTLGIALFWLGLMVGVIKWIGRTLVEISGGEPRQPRRNRETTEARLEQLFVQTGAASYIAAQRGTTENEVVKLAQRETEVRGQETALRNAAALPIPVGTTKSLPNAGRMTGVAVKLHCPMCGEPLSDVPVPLPYAVECPECHRRINARGDGPSRMSIGVVEPRRPIES